MSKLEETNPWARVLGLTVALPIVIGLMLFAFLAPSQNSAPDHLPMAVSAPEQAKEMVVGGLEQQAGDAIEVTELASADAVIDGIENREYIGGLVVEQDMSITIYQASGNGAPYGQILSGMAQGMSAQGMAVNVEDLAPLAEGDTNGTGLALIGLPLAFGGMISGALITLLLKRRPWMKVAASLLVSFVGAFVVSGILYAGYDLLDANYFGTTMAIAAGIASISLVAVGLGELIGLAGVGLTAIVVIFFSNPLSGLATGWWILPKPWGFIGQLLPIGATGELVRSIEYFNGNAVAMPVTVLLCWIAVGLLLVAAGSWRKPKNQLNVE